MKILVASHRYFPTIGGQETIAAAIAQSWAEDYEVEVLTYNHQDPSRTAIKRLNGLLVRYCAVDRYKFRIPFSKQFLKHLRSSSFDILHAHGHVPFTSDIALILGSRRKSNTILTHHFDGTIQDHPYFQPLASFYNRTFGRLAVKASKYVVATTKSYAKTSEVLGKHMVRSIVISPGIDTDKFKPCGNEIKQRIREHYAPNKKILILFVGRIVPYKGLHVLLDALRLLSKHKVDFSLLIVGKSEGKTPFAAGSPYYSCVVKEAQRKELRNSVYFLGEVSNELLVQLYSSSDLFVLPSTQRGEAFGLVLLESLACGTPVIAPTLQGVKEVLLGNQEIGRYAINGSAPDFARQILKAIDDGDYKRDKCRQFVIKHYPLQKMIDRYRKLLKLAESN
ncbi:MAG: glycosyltransferase family 4 protein [Candidatus Heimdallarchaeota archaeon]